MQVCCLPAVVLCCVICALGPWAGGGSDVWGSSIGMDDLDDGRALGKRILQHPQTQTPILASASCTTYGPEPIPPSDKHGTAFEQ